MRKTNENTDLKRLPRSRTFFITQAERHPTTGEILLTEGRIQIAIDTHKSIKHWAYIRHDERDTKEDGSPVAPHWHVAIQISSAAYPIDEVAKWFGIQPQFIEVGRTKGAFFNMCQYLTHRDEKSGLLGKFQYDPSEVRANFDYALMLSRSRMPSEKTLLRERVRRGELTVSELKENFFDEFEEDKRALLDARDDFFSRQEPPKTRICFYISGTRGSGKSVASESLARVLAEIAKPALADSSDDDAKYFIVSPQKQVTWERYDGQPVVIFDDCRSQDLLDHLGGREAFLRVFDPHPDKLKVNVKYSSIFLTSPFLIVNSTDSYQIFLDGLAGAYYDTCGRINAETDRGQVWRRFPIIFEVTANSVERLVNNGWLGYYKDGEKAFEKVSVYKHLSVNLNLWASRLQESPEVKKRGDHLLFGDTAKQVKELIDLEENKIGKHTPEEIEGWFSEYEENNRNQLEFPFGTPEDE